MHIIIVGGGGVGYELARNLSEKHQDVVVIEKNEIKSRRFIESLDVMVIVDNGANSSVLEKAGIYQADMLIAVTDLDEVNTVACMLAKQYHVPLTVCRIRDTGYVGTDLGLNLKQFGIDIMINPEQVAATEIVKMLSFPDASEIDYFSQGKVMLLGVTVGKETGITGVPIRKLPKDIDGIIVGVSKPNGKFIIPGGNDIIEPNSKIYLLGKSRPLKEISILLHHEETRVKQVIIFGGDAIGQQVALMLEKRKDPFTVKLIEKDEKRCAELSVKLKKTSILHGDATEIAIFKEEDIGITDVVVAVTSDDRTNIVTALLARQFGVKKIICEVKKLQYMAVYSALGIESLINPRLLAVAQIIRLTRRKEFVSLSILQGEKAEVFELVLPETAHVAHKKICEAHFPHGMLIGSIMRNEDVIIPNGNTELLPEDHLVIFSLPKVVVKLDHYFAPDPKKRL
jgi:trk system potassium uptake protein